jgi:uncharacterized membrane protein
MILGPVLSEISLIRTAFVFIDLSFIPGCLLLLYLDEFCFDLDRILYSVGSSLILIMVTGVILNLALPVIGFMRPMSVSNLIFGLTVLVCILSLMAYRRTLGREGVLTLVGKRITPAVPLFLLLIPLTVLSISVLQVFDQNLPIIVVLSVIAVIPLWLVLTDRFDWYALGVWGVAMALLYHATFSSQAYGGSSIPLHIMEVQHWTPGVFETASTTTSLVANGVLYTSYATLSDIPFYIQTSYINPILVSLLPVIIFQTYRKYVSDKMAFLGVSVFMFAHPFYRLYPGGGRVSTPVIFLALVGLLISDTRLNVSRKHLFSLLFATGIILSHYGTSYFVMFGFLGAYLVLSTFPYVKKSISYLPENVNEISKNNLEIETPDNMGPVVTASFTGFFVIAVLAWYLYTSGGTHFSLPGHIQRALASLFGGDLISGSTANRVQKSYGYNTLSIRLSRFIYIGLVSLMGVGFLIEVCSRIYHHTTSKFEDEYLAIAGIFLTVSGSSFLLPVGWGGGRPMMIAFTFIAVFAVVGLVRVVKLCRQVVELSPARINTPSTRFMETVALSSFATIVAVFLLLNSGVLAATIVGGTAPHNVPIQPKLDQRENPNFRSGAYVDTDVQTHAWLLDHRTTDYGIRGDLIVHGQTDKYRSSIAIAMDTDVVFPYEDSAPNGFLNRIENDRFSKYVLIMGHNKNLDVYTLNSTYERKSLDPLHDDLAIRDRIYTTGDSSIYFGPNERFNTSK